jgi:predicted PurR-regulated permease PerM
MATIQQILILLLTAGGIALAVVLVMVLFRVVRLLQQLTEDMRRIGDEMVPTLKHVQSMTLKAEEALSVVSDNREAVSQAVENLRKVTENIYRLENILQEQVEPSLTGLAYRLSGIRKGIDSFFETWRKKH